MARSVSSPPRLERADSGVYYIHWTEGRRSKRVSTRSRTLATAQAFFAEWLTLEQQAETKAGPAVTCEDAWSLYPKGTDPRNRQVWDALRPVFGDRPVMSVSQDDISRYVTLREGVGRARATIWLELTKLFASWRAAHEKGALAAVPRLKNIESPSPRDRWLRREELAALFKAAEELRGGLRLSRAERFLWLGLETAARRQAILSLRWRQIDFDLEVIDYTDGKPQRGLRKKRAVVPISAALLPVLRRAWDERESEYVLDHTGSVTHLLDRIAEKAKVSGVSPHVLRHTAATHMARNKVSLFHVAGVLGNSVAMVEKVYAKHTLDGLREAVNSLGAAPRLGTENGRQ